jgi:hypothetical protein
MKLISRIIVIALAFLTPLAVGGKFVVMAAPTVTCPPLCILPPDPAPPMPPLPLNDPPLRPLRAMPSGGSGATTTAAPSALTVRKAGGNPSAATATTNGAENPKETVYGLKQPGTACTVGSHYGTVVQSGGGYSCNFTPSTLPSGSSCQYNGSSGTVTVVDGKHYCKI